MPVWTIERVRALSADHMRTLRQNALDRGNAAVADLCTRALAELPPARGRRTRAHDREASVLDDNAVAAVAAAIELLVPAADADFTQAVRANIDRRRKRIAEVGLLTLSDLWWQYLVCAFSSQEKSGRGSAVLLFEQSASLLHSLPAVAQAGADPDWVAAQFELFARECTRAGVPRFRFTVPKVEVVLQGYPLFARAGAPDDRLVNCCQTGGELKLFCDLARGTIDDCDIAESARFSRGIDPTPFHGVSHKQVRNILVNAGLCRNVVPLDSRWQEFLEEKAGLSIPKKFGQRTFYLSVEDLLRRALMTLLQANPTFPVPDLSTLDAVVFEYFD